jgi:hypothetical protein
MLPWPQSCYQIWLNYLMFYTADLHRRAKCSNNDVTTSPARTKVVCTTVQNLRFHKPHHFHYHTTPHFFHVLEPIQSLFPIHFPSLLSTCRQWFHVSRSTKPQPLVSVVQCVPDCHSALETATPSHSRTSNQNCQETNSSTS